MESDPNFDGVSLLMAYALNLDPNKNLAGSMPKPALEGGALSISFYSGSEGITYSVESSVDLITWGTEEVAVSDPDSEKVRKATVDLSESQRFIRLVVTE